MQVSESVFRVTVNAYNADNDLTELSIYQTDRSGEYFKTRYSYDSSRRKTKERVVLVDNTELTTEWQYDPTTGWMTNRIDPNGNAMAYAYNVYGFRIRKYDPNYQDYETEYLYDSTGNVTNKIDALGRVWTYGHDKLDRKVYERSPLNYESFWTYNGPNLVQVEQGRDGVTPGRLTTNEYNGLNQLISTHRLDDNDQAVRWMTYKRDSEGKVLSEINALNFTNTYTYDPSGILTNRFDGFGAKTQFTIDNWGNETEVQNAVGVVERREYDYTSRLTNRG